MAPNATNERQSSSSALPDRHDQDESASSSSTIPPESVRIEGKVYSALDIARMHPGGELWVRSFAGRDATMPFMSYHRRKFPHSRYVVRLHGLCLRLPFLSCAFNNFFRVKHALEFTDPDVKEDLELSEDFLELCERVEKVLPRMKSFAPWTYYIKASFIWGMAIYLEMYMHYTGKRNRVQKTSEQIN